MKDAARRLGTAYLDGSSSKPGVSYHPIYFDGYDVPAHKYACVSELKAIVEDLRLSPVSSMTCLDIGSSVGFFSFAFADRGYKVLAYEGDPAAYNVAMGLKQEHAVSLVDFRNECFTDSVALQNFGVGLCLNVHMWIEKQIGVDRTKTAMRNLFAACERTYFQTAHQASSGKYLCRLKDDIETGEYLSELSGKDIHLLQETKGHGKPRHLFRVG